MYGYADERVVKVLALMGLLAMVGVAMAPIVQQNLGAYFAMQGEGEAAAALDLGSAGTVWLTAKGIEIGITLGLIAASGGIYILAAGVVVAVALAI